MKHELTLQFLPHFPKIVLFLMIQQVEPFICDVVGVSKRLVEAITPFTEEEHPNTVQVRKGVVVTPLLLC